jgi:hypothetical protein
MLPEKQAKSKRAGGMAQIEGCLLSKCEAVSSFSNTKKKKERTRDDVNTKQQQKEKQQRRCKYIHIL